MADAQDIDDLSELIFRIGQNRTSNQATFVQKTVAMSLPMEEDYQIPPAEERYARPIPLMKNQRGKKVVNAYIGGTAGFGAYDDLGARPAGSGRPVTQGEKLPGLYGETLLFSLSETDIADGGDAQTINKVELTLKAHGSQVGAYFARALIDPSLDEPTGDVAAASTSMTVQDASGYLEGQRYEVRVVATEALVGEFVVSMVTPTFGGGGTIAFEDALDFTIDVSEQAIYLKGQGMFSDPKHLGSLKDVTDSALNMYGLSRTTIFPAGIYQSIGGAWSDADGKEAHSMLGMGRNPTHWHGSPRAGDRVSAAQSDNIRFLPGKSDKRDPHADVMVQEYCGLPFIRCPMGLDTRVSLGDFNRVEFREHVPYGPRRVQGAGKAEMGRGALRESEDLFAMKVLFDGRYSAVFDSRRHFLTLDNITG